jgi:hypothetical protein
MATRKKGTIKPDPDLQVTEPIQPKPPANIVAMKLGSDHLPHKPTIHMLKRGPVVSIVGLPKIEHPVFRITNDTKRSKTFKVCYLPETDTLFTVNIEAGQSVKIGIIIKPEPDAPPKD